MQQQMFGRLCHRLTAHLRVFSSQHPRQSYCFSVAEYRLLYSCSYLSGCSVRGLVHSADTPEQLSKYTRTQNGIRMGSMWGSSAKANDWNRAVSEAEKIVGYSTSFLSLRCLLSDELSNVAMQMRKLVGTGHPLLKTARKLFYDGNHSMQTRGLLVLLMAKAAGPGLCNSESHEAMVGGIYPSQRSLAEIVEMIHTASLIHRGIVNISQPVDGECTATVTTARNSDTDDFEFGNKMSVLSGDFLLANASTGLAGLNNTQVVEVISIALGDMMRAEFTALRDSCGNAVLPASAVTIQDWETQTFLTSGSLLSSSCKAALMLAAHSDSLQQQAYEFGQQIALAYQLNEELLQIADTDESANGLSLTSAPAILYLNSPHCELNYDELAISADHKHLRRLVAQDSIVLQEVRRLRDKYGQGALDALQCFAKSDAGSALQNIVHAATSI